MRKAYQDFMNTCQCRPTTATVSVPYLGMNEQGQTTRNWAHFRMSRQDGVIHPRQVKRVIRKYVKGALGRDIHPEELAMCMRRVEYSA